MAVLHGVAKTANEQQHTIMKLNWAQQVETKVYQYGDNLFRTLSVLILFGILPQYIVLTA
jgi:hypothetical protein